MEPINKDGFASRTRRPFSRVISVDEVTLTTASLTDRRGKAMPQLDCDLSELYIRPLAQRAPFSLVLSPTRCLVYLNEMNSGTTALFITF